MALTCRTNPVELKVVTCTIALLAITSGHQQQSHLDEELMWARMLQAHVQDQGSPGRHALTLAVVCIQIAWIQTLVLAGFQHCCFRCCWPGNPFLHGQSATSCCVANPLMRNGQRVHAGMRRGEQISEWLAGAGMREGHLNPCALTPVDWLVWSYEMGCEIVNAGC